MPDVPDEMNVAIEGLFQQRPWMTDEDRDRLESEYGSQLRQDILELLEFTESQSDVWMKNADLAVSAREVGQRLAARYPGLSTAAINKAVNAAAYTWR